MMDFNKIKARVEEFFHGQYVVEQFIGEGAFAEVFLIRHVFLDDLRVMKIVKEPVNSFSKLSSIFQEVRIASPLKHENIISIYDAGIISSGGDFSLDFVYFIMEYIPSGDLYQYLNSFIKSEKFPPLYWVFVLIKQVCFGLNVLHSSSPIIVHGDLKPSNILLSFNSQDRVVAKLTDFGFSKEIYSDASSYTVAGTRPFMAPECFKKEFYPASDIYAVGVLFYVFLTNHLPYYLGDYDLCDIIEGKPWMEEIIPPSRYNDKVSPVIDGIVLKCLSYDHKNRYKNAKDLYQSIEACLNNMSIYDKETYIMNKDVVKAFRLAKFENKLDEAMVLLEKHDMALIFEDTIEKNDFSSYKTVSLKNFSEILDSAKKKTILKTNWISFFKHINVLL